jgi:hypothetical protein
VRQSESTQKEVAVGWLRERDELKTTVTEMTRKVDQLQEQLNGRVREVETLVRNDIRKLIIRSARKNIAILTHVVNEIEKMLRKCCFSKVHLFISSGIT